MIPPASMSCTTFCFYQPAFCRVCVFILWTSCLLINKLIKIKLSSILQLSVYKFDPYTLVQDDLQRRMLLRGAYGLSPRFLIGCHLLQLTASPWTTEASTREWWQFGALTNRKATTSNRDPSLTSLCYYKVALSIYRDMWSTIIRLWWLSQWLVARGHHLAVTICLHVVPSTDHHTSYHHFTAIRYFYVSGGQGKKLARALLSAHVYSNYSSHCFAPILGDLFMVS